MLPESYVNRMNDMLGDEAREYFDCFNYPGYAGLRVNTLKISPEKFKEISPFEISQITWTRKGFYVDSKDKPAKHPYYYGGLYYIQEPSAMAPASVLPVNEHDKVLDLCAAPGGKSTELGAKLNGTGVLVTNDISASRAKALLKNVEVCGISNAIVTSEAPYAIAKHFQGFFDKILVDAPCSGEGMFRKDNAIVKNYAQYGVKYYSDIQREIIPYAIDMLRPGGYMVYSTCTFSPEEDEQLISYILSLGKGMSVEKIILDNQIAWGDVDYPFENGVPGWSDGNKELLKCARLWPHKLKGEGHFVTLLRKDCDAFTQSPAITTVKGNVKKLPQELLDFVATIDKEFDYERFIISGTKVYYIPETMLDMKGIRILRNGLFMGEIKTKRFEPSQALASSLKMDEFSNCVSFSIDDERVIKYLKGETIQIDDINGVDNGFVLVCVDGYSLGFAKNNNGTLKNRYLPGWRWM